MDIQEYLDQMVQAKARIADAIRTAQRRLEMNGEMQDLADDAEDPDIAMGAEQKAALVADQLTLTKAADAPLAAAKAALE